VPRPIAARSAGYVLRLDDAWVDSAEFAMTVARAREAFANGRHEEARDRDDDKYWRGGLVYINREDPALMVARRFGVGWTLNFGNPRTAMLLAGVVALIGLATTLRFGGADPVRRRPGSRPRRGVTAFGRRRPACS
jgi:hypothetical protein